MLEINFQINDWELSCSKLTQPISLRLITQKRKSESKFVSGRNERNETQLMPWNWDAYLPFGEEDAHRKFQLQSTTEFNGSLSLPPSKMSFFFPTKIMSTEWAAKSWRQEEGKWRIKFPLLPSAKFQNGKKKLKFKKYVNCNKNKI